MKRISFLALLCCAAALGPTRAATNQTTLHQVSGFLEWALGVRFTLADRVDLARVPIDDATASGIFKTQSLVASLSTEQKAQLQPGVEVGFVKALRENGSSEASRLLLRIYDRERRGAPAAFRPTSAPLSIPAQLV